MRCLDRTSACSLLLDHREHSTHGHWTKCSSLLIIAAAALFLMNVFIYGPCSPALKWSRLLSIWSRIYIFKGIDLLILLTSMINQRGQTANAIFCGPPAWLQPVTFSEKMVAFYSDKLPTYAAVICSSQCGNYL